MCGTKTLVICFLVIILAVSLSNNNVLVSGIKNFDVDHCDTRCYGKDECMNYCIQAGYRSGECGSLCIPCPIKCCCQK
ncbi:PREDICTED: defensin-like protein 46 [Camelina sativa]|uniref:Defensin-like protein 46 n=1 Tax=Camelina sativa TaxID=90675 RepID=A0ABM0SR81_CAMSA|nr:PREDICTED: defensin-like protein 46 [Camelina sativa]